ncbi:hypothetical protein C5167_006361 [Papaver somniferum]|uniref:Formin-like protein n=1 Tax=Papaver somniferum TaxID=3469 RepID=A0A4Y7JG95_PAPSO|nr:formin-like protein 4 [Papaver somniferum]RZC59062.1 hypothetical protein C5167_006361 [Papaver somniferum]
MLLFQSWVHLVILIIAYLTFLPFSYSSSHDQVKPTSQNIEVFFPFHHHSQPIPSSNPLSSSSSNVPHHQYSTTSLDATLAKAFAGLVASIVVVAGVLFFCRKYNAGRGSVNTKIMGIRRPREIRVNINNDDHQLKPIGGDDKTGLVVDENGLDVIYWRQLQLSSNDLPKKDSLSKAEKKYQELIGISKREFPKPSIINSSTTLNSRELQVQVQQSSIPPLRAAQSGHFTRSPSTSSTNDMATALFGYVAANRISAKSNNVSPNNATKLSTDPTAQIFILDPYKSQKTAMVIRSLHITRKEILDALLEGKMSLDLETLQKLSDIAPTKEEEEQILAFNGNQTKLADAESFIYHLLKSVPSPFARLKAMLFLSKYDSKVCYLKMSLQTLELGCNELRTNGVFYKLFEAIATTQGTITTEFNLNELRNRCNMKNDNECTHQLEAIVEQVIINEGKRSITRQSQTLKGRNGTSRKSESSLRQRDDHEYRTLGLPVIEGLCKELSHVKKAAYIDYTAVERTCFSLKAGFVEIRELFIENTNDGNKLEDDGFVETMKRFLYRAEEDVKIVKKDEKRVEELVKKTREIYFQNQEIITSTASSDGDHQNLLQVFVMVRELIRMVDQICTDIAGNLKKMETDGLRFQRLSSIL